MQKGYHVLLGWRLKGIRETLGVMIYDPQLAVCVSTPIESLILEQDQSPRVLVLSKSNLLPFRELSWGGVGVAATCGISFLKYYYCVHLLS